MTHARHEEFRTGAIQPRSHGTLRLVAKHVGNGTGVSQFRTSGCIKALFPRSRGALEAIVVNTSGGLTSGDTLRLSATAGDGSALTLTTQAAERAYRAEHGPADVTTELAARPGSTLHWLPQELILYEGAALRRSLCIELAATARILFVEPVVFGRTAMGERLTRATFHDRINVRREGAPLYRDGLDLTGDVSAMLSGPATAGGALAMASVLYVAPDADAHLEPVRQDLPETAGASCLAPDVLVLRIVAQDGFHLRRTLMPVLDRLTRNTLPTSWRL